MKSQDANIIIQKNFDEMTDFYNSLLEVNDVYMACKKVDDWNRISIEWYRGELFDYVPESEIKDMVGESTYDNYVILRGVIACIISYFKANVTKDVALKMIKEIDDYFYVQVSKSLI